MEIDSIVNSLKTMSQVSNYKIYVSGSLPMNVGFRLKAKARSSPKCWCKLNSANLSFHKLKHTGFF